MNSEYEKGIIDAAIIAAKVNTLPVSTSYEVARHIWMLYWQLKAKEAQIKEV